MLKVLKQFLVVMGLMTVVLSTIAMPMAFVQAANTTPKTSLPLPSVDNYGDLPAPARGGSSSQQFSALVVGVIQNVRYILGAVAIALFVYAGLRMVIGQGNEDIYTKQRQSIVWAIIGLALVGMSGEIVKIFSVYCDKSIPGAVCTPGGFLSDPNSIVRTATLFNKQTQFLIVFIKYFIGSVSVLMIVRSGLRMIAMGSREDQVALDKKNLSYGVLGLALIILADAAINKVFYKVDLSRYPGVGGAAPSFDAAEGVKQIIGLTNIIVSIVGPVAVLALLAGGIMYITAAGKEDQQGKAKRLILSAIVGILVIYGAFAIVSTFVSGRFDSVAQPTVQETGT